MTQPKPIGADPTGYEILTKAVKDLLNRFPGLDGQKIYFEEQGAEAGIAFFGRGQFKQKPLPVSFLYEVFNEAFFC